MARNVFLFFMVFSYSISSCAGLYPVATNVRATIMSNQSTKIEFGQALIEIGDASEMILTGAGATRWVGIAANRLYFTDLNFVMLGGPDNIVYVGKPTTIGAAARQAFLKQGGINTAGMWSVIPNSKWDACVGYIASPSKYSGFWSSVVSPAGTCIKVPDPNQWCNIISPAIELNHGVISLADVASSVASSRLKVNCSTGMKVRLRLSTNKEFVPLQKSGSADLFIQGERIGGEFNLPAGESELIVSDKLRGISDVGMFYGSGVVIIEPA